MTGAMPIAGSLIANLEGAVESVRRHRGERLYPETLERWRRLLDHARISLRSITDISYPVVQRLTDELEDELRAVPAPTSPR